jgi:hypothetical protein
MVAGHAAYTRASPIDKYLLTPEMSKEETLFKTQPSQKAEMIGYCPGCDQPITEDQVTKLVLGQLYHAAHAPRAESGK